MQETSSKINSDLLSTMSSNCVNESKLDLPKPVWKDLQLTGESPPALQPSCWDVGGKMPSACGVLLHSAACGWSCPPSAGGAVAGELHRRCETGGLMGQTWVKATNQPQSLTENGLHKEGNGSKALLWEGIWALLRARSVSE